MKLKTTSIHVGADKSKRENKPEYQCNSIKTNHQKIDYCKTAETPHVIKVENTKYQKTKRNNSVNNENKSIKHILCKLFFNWQNLNQDAHNL